MSDLTVWMLFLLACAVVLDAIPPPKRKRPSAEDARPGIYDRP
jgi:hypothetical protein